MRRSHDDPLVDADLWGFVLDPMGNSAKIRQEYCHLSDEEWKAGRTAFLETMKNRRPFFANPDREAMHGETARANCLAEQVSLR